MKICTDSLLFGAMMPIRLNDWVLDIGAGSGLLSLIAAQLGAGRVTGVELMDDTCREAAENFRRSPWTDRLHAVRDSIQHFASTRSSRYDLIVSNPPFFENHLNADEPMRNVARHDVHLKHGELVGIADRLLAQDGVFYVLMPVKSGPAFIRRCGQTALHLSRQAVFRSFAHSVPKVTALTFVRPPVACPVFETVTVYDAPNVYSAAARACLARFLMRFAGSESANDGD